MMTWSFLHLLHEAVERLGDAPSGGLLVQQHLEVVAIQRAARWRAQEVGECLGVPVGEAQVGDVLFLVVGDADDDGIGGGASVEGLGGAPFRMTKAQ
jgi:hypothetical protein